MSENKNYDELLYPILYHQGDIVNFLDTIFDFLSRRTDFFKIKRDSTSNFGLPFGDAEKLVRTSFCKFYEKAVIQHKADLQEDNVTLESSVPENIVPVREEVVSSSGDANRDKKSLDNVDNMAGESKLKSEKVEEHVYQSDSECYNGARYDTYSWAQSIKDLDIQVKIPQHITKSTQVKVDIKQNHIKVETREELEWTVLIDGDLSWKINLEESAWTLIPREHIHINLEKLEERWWDSFLTSEPKIDVQKIDASKHYEDLDEESRAKIQELMYNEHQKRLGKPTIQQSKVTDVLRQAWDLENSPFKGLPFDPSIIDMSGSDFSGLK